MRYILINTQIKLNTMTEDVMRPLAIATMMFATTDGWSRKIIYLQKIGLDRTL